MRPVVALAVAALLGWAAAGPASASKITDAEAAFAAGRDDEAMALFQQALSDPGLDAAGRAAAHFGRGEVHSLSGRYEEAIADFTAALAAETDPKVRAAAHFSRAEALARRRQEDAAIADYTESLKLEPDALGVHYARGSLYRRLGRKDEALADFDAELKKNPTSYRANTARAELLGLPLPKNNRY